MGYMHFYRKAWGFLILCLFTSMCFAQPKEQWVKQYNGPANGGDEAFSMAVDASGNVYVAGLSASGKTLEDYVIIKYNTAGNILWERRYNGPGNGYDKPCSIAVNAQGEVYVTGVSLGNRGESDMDYATIKYDASGNVLWTKRYNGPANNWDEATCLAMDASGYVYVSGMSYRNGTDYDFVTIKYDREGNQLWEKRYNGPGNDIDRASSMAVDGSGNVYVTGNSFLGATLDFVTIKYDASGYQVWVKRYSGTQDSYDSGTSVAVDSFGDVCVTGYSIGSETDYDFVTIKYDAKGNELLTRRYNGEGNSTDIPSALFVDADGNFYITGSSKNAGTSDDYLTIKYDREGHEQWVRRYNGRASGTDYASSLFVDIQGNVYVTGTSQVGIGPLAYDFVTIKYDKNGNERWVKRYNGPRNMNDGAKSVAVDDHGNVYVTGFSANSDTNTDIVTIKYNQTTVTDHSCGKKGDRVLVCHNGKTLCLPQSAVAAHLKHGDKLGSCNTSTSLNSNTENNETSLLTEQRVKDFRVSVTPNPFSTTASVQYALPTDGTVVIKVYNMNGREVATMVQGDRKAGVYHTNFSAQGLVKGVYNYRAWLTAKQKTYLQTGKMIVK